MPKHIYFFGGGKADGHAGMKDLLGGKGAGVAEMTHAGIPVPPGFTITTQLCRIFYEAPKQFPKDLTQQMAACLHRVGQLTGTGFADADNPLLVSVRSGARFSMPGMMDTILNLGLDDRTVEGLARRTGNPRFAWDCYRRFIQMFGSVVLDIGKDVFEHELSAVKAAKGATSDTQLAESDLRGVVDRFKAVVREQAKREFPQEPMEQLVMARDAVFRSWNNPRAITYRNIYKIPHDIGTAVTVQAMVFGNMGETSATGVGFTRDPGNGERRFYGEYLVNAQGEDVVAGIRTPKPIAEMEKEMPEAFAQLRAITSRLEKHYRDVQDFEFTIQQGKLYLLQTRSGKRTGLAALRIAVEMVDEKVISAREAVSRVEPAQLEQVLHPIFDPVARRAFKSVAKGLPASPGAAAGRVCFDADEAVEHAKKGERVLLVRQETCPDDIHGMHASKGILTATGGMTSHAAVVGRQMGKPCVVGCSALRVDEAQRTFTVGDKTVASGEYVSIDGATGEVMIGDVPNHPSEVIQVMRGELPAEQSLLYRQFTRLLGWADKLRTIKVRANADIPVDAQMAIKMGAEGTGLCRTEHMFFATERLPWVQQLIIYAEEARRERKAGHATAEAVKKYDEALEMLLPYQRADFKGLFEEMRGRPVTIRTIDPPLHEFLPKREDLMVDLAVAKATGKTEGIAGKEQMLQRVEALHEFNPMLGHRGCRLGITYPEITRMQVRAIIEAACEGAKTGQPVIPEIMIPLVGSVTELADQRKVVEETARATLARLGAKLKYTIGTMIEVPRAALTAEEVAQQADFFSFGTNDLTQMTFGFSRDDIGKFLGDYVEAKILPGDPFVSIDRRGVGRLIQLAVEGGRKAKPNLKIGICGEHGGDPDSVAFCHESGFDYVSCSPFRVPVARLAAAHAALAEGEKAAPAGGENAAPARAKAKAKPNAKAKARPAAGRRTGKKPAAKKRAIGAR